MTHHKTEQLITKIKYTSPYFILNHWSLISLETHHIVNIRVNNWCRWYDSVQLESSMNIDPSCNVSNSSGSSCISGVVKL